MIKLGVPPKLMDFINESASFINTWFREVTNRLTIQRRDGAFDVDQLPTDQWAVTKDTNSGVVGLAFNDDGTLKSIYVPPAFYSYRSSILTLGSGTSYNTFTFDAENFDTEGWYDTTTGKFQPLLEGYYLFVTSVNFTMGGALPNCTCAIAIRKNGTVFSETFTLVPGIVTDYSPSVTTIVYLNGTTDYVDVGVWQNSGTSQGVGNASTKSYLTGTLIRGAS